MPEAYSKSLLKKLSIGMELWLMVEDGEASEVLVGRDRQRVEAHRAIGARAETWRSPREVRSARRGRCNSIRRSCGLRVASAAHDFPPWNSVFKYFSAWKKAGVWKEIHDDLRGDVREAEGRERYPSAGIIDSQSVKTTERGASRLRCGQENLWTQETPPRRHARSGPGRGRASGRHAGS
jgi:transposase